MNSTPLDLARCKNTRAARRAGQIIRLLKIIGVPKQMLYVRRLRENGSFWLREINHLEVLERARWLYREQIVRAHPDKAGGCPEMAMQLNRTWGEIKRRFKEHGHELAGGRRRLKTERKIMKLETQFDPEMRFKQPVRRLTPSQVQQSPDTWASLRALIKARQLKPIQPELTGESISEDPSP